MALFVGSSEDQTTPMLVTALKGLKVVDVACGSGDAQTLAVTENGESLFGLSLDKDLTDMGFLWPILISQLNVVIKYL